MTRRARAVVAFTDRELGAVRALVNVTIESAQPARRDRDERKYLATLARAQAKLDTARRQLDKIARRI